ncbi:tight adherence pilus pseudopilin TadF [Yersinia enterocolitica]|uniref:tight adherence pilus pseudopilin TadF n=1 Tax=Yersinia enterocolitica TaxID=630 RepID=UPI002980DE51|nr:tight adherence pilus pseudopilin TadF [Yersinia enterocolitica]
MKVGAVTGKLALNLIYSTKPLSAGTVACNPTQPLHEMDSLSPYGNTGRWIPLYQVTLCLPTIPWYSTLFSPETPAPAIKSSAITIGR